MHLEKKDTMFDSRLLMFWIWYVIHSSLITCQINTVRTPSVRWTQQIAYYGGVPLFMMYSHSRAREHAAPGGGGYA
jgi:hypothetical protein